MLLRFAALYLAANWGASGAEVAHINLTKPAVKCDTASGGSGEGYGVGLPHGPKPDPHRIPPVSIEIRSINKFSSACENGAHAEIILENIGTGDLTLPIGIDTGSLLAAGAGRAYLTLALKGPGPTGPDFGSARLAMNEDHLESAATLRPGDTIAIEISLEKKPEGVDSVPLTATLSLHRITTSGQTVHDEQVGSEVRFVSPLSYR